MPYENVLLEVTDNVAHVTINRPAKRNALSTATLDELADAFTQCENDPAVRVVVLTGAGDKAFCAGADLAETQTNAVTPEYTRFIARRSFTRLFELLPNLSKPVIARVQGAALAGGLGLAASADFVIAADTANFGTPEINVGMFPMMILAIISRNVGRKKALDLLLTGRIIDAAEAERIGLVTRVVPAADLDATVDILAADLAAKSPAIMRLGKHAFYTAADMPFEAALEYLRSMLGVVLATEDSQEGLTAFLEKRSPQWKDR